MEKRQPDDDMPPELFIRHHTETIEDCVNGSQVPRAFLRWVRIDRWSLHTWCQRQNVPLPAFWFPPGWNLSYQWPDDGEPEPVNPAEPIEEQRGRIDKRHRTQMACQQVALAIWAKEPKLTIKEVAWRKEVQDLAGGSAYEPETVEGWISQVDSRNPATKRGRKRKNNPGSDESGDKPNP